MDSRSRKRVGPLVSVSAVMTDLASRPMRSRGIAVAGAGRSEATAAAASGPKSPDSTDSLRSSACSCGFSRA
ncbi:hypothetical protein GCM10009578_073490 [Streptomyces rhizosphaericus]